MPHIHKASQDWPQMEARRRKFGKLFDLLPLHLQLGLTPETRRVAVLDYHDRMVTDYQDGPDGECQSHWIGPHRYRKVVSVARTWARVA